MVDGDAKLKNFKQGIMYKNVCTVILAVLFISCSIKPEPLNFGQDACHTCKMTLMDKKFGAEVVMNKGKVYKFDDLNCLINFNNSEYEPEENIAYRLVVDFAYPEKLIHAKQAFYSKSNHIKSPMSSHIAAFEKKEDLETYNKEWEGIILTWGELVTQFK